MPRPLPCAPLAKTWYSVETPAFTRAWKKARLCWIGTVWSLKVW